MASADVVAVPHRKIKRRRRRRQDKPAITARLVLDDHVKSDVGIQILRQSTMLADNRPAKPMTWVENGILRNFAGGLGSPGVNNSLVQGGTELSIEDMIK